MDSWYWGDMGGGITSTDIFKELRIINAEYGMELDLSKETWQPIVKYMEWFNNEEDLSNEWQEHFYGFN